MERRRFLAGVSLVSTYSLAGCSELSSLLESEEFELGDRSELLPDSVMDEWPDQDLERTPELNDSFDRVFSTPDTGLAIMMSVNIYNSISSAKDAFQKSWSTAHDPSEYPLADEGLIYSGEQAARCHFRRSNALGQVLAARSSGVQMIPDRQRATRYAEIWYRQLWA